MSELRVLHVVTSLEPGGMENGVCNLAQQLKGRGIETVVACLERSGPFAELLPDPGAVEVLGKKSRFTPAAVFALRRCIRRRNPQIVHAHNLGPLIYSAFATLWGNSPALLQGEHSQLAPWELTPKRLRQRRLLYHACRGIHTVSEPQREELLRLGFRAERIVAIANGVDTGRFRPGARAQARSMLGLPQELLAAGIIGRFGPHKGHRVMLEAFAMAAAQNSRAGLVIIGGGGSEEDAITKAVAAHPFRDRIYLTGFRADLERCYPALDLLVLPSTNEGMSNAAIEAMACGIPALANAGAGNEAIITPNRDGWIADLRNPDVLAARLLERLADPATLRAAGEKARQTVESRFSLVQMVDAYERLYRRFAS